MNLHNRVRKLEDAATAQETIHYRFLWDNGDGTCTDAETGEIVTPGPDVIRLLWPEDLGQADGDAEAEASGNVG